MKIQILCTFLLVASNLFAQPKLISNSSFGPGEKLFYVASYNMKGLMTELAGIDMEVIDVPGKKRPINRLKFTANTLTSWDGYVKVRHSYQTYVDPSNIRPLIMAQDSDVKGIITKGKYTFKYKSGFAKMTVTKSDAPDINKNLTIKANTYDVVSFIYLLRNIDYSALKVGQKVPLSLAFLERLIDFNVKYMGKETVKVDGMGNKECYKIGVVLKQKFIVEPDVTFIWVTADANHVPVLISTVFKEGKALIKLAKHEGLKH